ncbi:MAG: T9SS type A sorting domain-containing protein [Bacteroidetes bacterium]|nr:T9SS type A sorting domain-containing protein [Bacteroidota bacterium]
MIRYSRNLVTIFLLISATTLSAQIPKNGLVGYWPFDGNGNDSSGYGNHATIYNASLTFDRFGHPNSAYYLDGDSDFMDLGRDKSLLGSSNSFNFWMRFTDTTQSQTVLSNFSSINGEWGISMWYGLTDGWQIDWASGLNNKRVGHKTHKSLNDDKWHMVTGVYNKLNNSGTVYIDGVKSGNINFASSQAFDQNDSVSFNDKEHWTVGANSQAFTGENNNGARYFTGYFDDLLIYNRPLDSNEVLILYNLSDKKTGLRKIESISFRIYPNPATESIILETPNQMIGQNLDVTIWNLAGLVVQNFQFDNFNGTTKIPINLPSDIYLVTVLDRESGFQTSLRFTVH